LGPLAGGVTEAAALAAMHHAVAKGGVLLLCRGNMSPGMHQALVPLIGAELEPLSLRARSLQRAWLAAAEWLEGLEPRTGDPVIALAQGADGPVLVVGLTLPAARAREVATAVEALNAMEPAALKARYRDALLGRGEPVGGGVRGMLDLALHGRAALRTAQYPADGGVLLLLRALI
jgi:hypothetical protein